MIIIEKCLLKMIPIKTAHDSIYKRCEFSQQARLTTRPCFYFCLTSRECETEMGTDFHWISSTFDVIS